MTITAEEVKKIGRLSKLGLTDQDAEGYSNDLENIFELVGQLKSIDTHTITPLDHPLEMRQRLRADVVTETNQRELFLSLAPAHAAGMYLVPQVIEE